MAVGHDGNAVTQARPRGERPSEDAVRPRCPSASRAPVAHSSAWLSPALRAAEPTPSPDDVASHVSCPSKLTGAGKTPPACLHQSRRRGRRTRPGAAVRGTSPATFQARAVKRSWPAPRAPPAGFLSSPMCSSVKCGEEGPFRRARGRGGGECVKGPGRCPRKVGALPLPSSHSDTSHGAVAEWRLPSSPDRAAVALRPTPRRTGACRPLSSDAGRPAARGSVAACREAAGSGGPRRGGGETVREPEGRNPTTLREGAGLRRRRSEAALVSDILEEAKPRAGRRQWSPGAWRFRGQGSCPVWY